MSYIKDILLTLGGIFMSTSAFMYDIKIGFLATGAFLVTFSFIVHYFEYNRIGGD